MEEIIMIPTENSTKPIGFDELRGKLIEEKDAEIKSLLDVLRPFVWALETAQKKEKKIKGWVDPMDFIVPPDLEKAKKLYRKYRDVESDH